MKASISRCIISLSSSSRCHHSSGNFFENDANDYGYEEDNGDVESLRVEEAAQIWASQAKMKITCLGIQKMN